MSSDVIYSSKPYRNNWLSQFGLYRYESATSDKKRYDSERKICVHFVTCIAALSLLSFIIFIFVNAKNGITFDDSDGDEPGRVIFLSEIDAASRNGTSTPKHSLTTVFYPNEQIGAYRNFERVKYRSTTPMNLRVHESSTVAYQSDDPPNHRKRFAEVLPRDERLARDDDISIDFQMHNDNKNYSTSHVVFPDDAITGSDSNVNSIRDILDQLSDYPHSSGNVNESLFPSSNARSRGIRIAGTYRRYRQFELSDPFVTMQSTINAQQVPATNAGYGKRTRPKDPFSKFKPKSVSDVNLLATNQVRFAPYTHHKPRPVLRSPIDDNKSKPSDYANQNVAESMYNQILWANSNRMKTTAEPMNSRDERVPKKQKPFSLMLDVYPMPSGDDDMSPVSSTRYTPYANRQPPPPPRPIYSMPVDANAINHNLQYGNDNSYYNQIKFPQLQSYHRVPNDASSSATAAAAPHYVNGPHPNYYYYRNYAPKRQNVYAVNQYRRRPTPSVYDVPSPSDDAPSQITVHLNLFPNKKKAKSSSTSRMRNIQVLDPDNLSNTAVAAPVSAGDDSNDDNDDVQFYKRRMEYENLADSARISTPLLSSSSHSASNNKNNIEELSFRPLKSPTFAPAWLLPHLNKDVKSTNTSFVKTIAEDMRHSTESIELDATTSDENIHSTNTAKPFYGNHSLVTSSGRRRNRLFLPESTQSDIFSMSSSTSAQPVASFDDINRATIWSTLSSNVAHATHQPTIIQTTTITDEVRHPIRFPQN